MCLFIFAFILLGRRQLLVSSPHTRFISLIIPLSTPHGLIFPIITSIHFVHVLSFLRFPSTLNSPIFSTLSLLLLLSICLNHLYLFSLVLSTMTVTPELTFIHSFLILSNLDTHIHFSILIFAIFIFIFSFLFNARQSHLYMSSWLYNSFIKLSFHL